MKQYLIGSAPAPSKGQVPIVVNEPQVSRMHCRFFMDGNQVYIEDLGSLNGTYVDGIRIQAATSIHEHSTVMLADKYPFNIFDYLPVEGSAHAEENMEYASFGTRFIAYLVDGIFVGVLLIILSFIFGFLIWNMPGMIILVQLGGLFLIIHFYFALPISRKGTTFGRKMFGIEYLSLATMDYPDVGKVWLRVFGYMLSGALFGIGFLLPLFTERKQALHDLLANTIVVKK